MRQIVYVTPNFTANTVRFLEGLTGIHDIRLSVISQEPVHLLPSWQQSRIMYASTVPDIFNTDALFHQIDRIQQRLDAIDRILGANEQLQIPLAMARERFGISGMNEATAQNFRDKARMKNIFEKAG